MTKKITETKSRRLKQNLEEQQSFQKSGMTRFVRLGPK